MIPPALLSPSSRASPSPGERRGGDHDDDRQRIEHEHDDHAGQAEREQGQERQLEDQVEATVPEHATGTLCRLGSGLSTGPRAPGSPRCSARHTLRALAAALRSIEYARGSVSEASTSAAAPFRLLLRVRYNECDAQGIVFNARWGDYADIASGEYVRALFGSVHPAETGLDWRLVKQTIEWQAPARYDDVLELAIRTLRVGTTSFALETRFVRHADRAPLAVIETVCVMVDHAGEAPDPRRGAGRSRARGAGRHRRSRRRARLRVRPPR